MVTRFQMPLEGLKSPQVGSKSGSKNPTKPRDGRFSVRLGLSRRTSSRKVVQNRHKEAPQWVRQEK